MRYQHIAALAASEASTDDLDLRQFFWMRPVGMVKDLRQLQPSLLEAAKDALALLVNGAEGSEQNPADVVQQLRTAVDSRDLGHFKAGEMRIPAGVPAPTDEQNEAVADLYANQRGGEHPYSSISLDADQSLAALDWFLQIDAVGIVEEASGGFVAYAHTENAERLASLLNVAALAIEREKTPDPMSKSERLLDNIQADMDELEKCAGEDPGVGQMLAQIYDRVHSKIVRLKES